MITITVGRIGTTLAGTVVLASTVLAAATIWLLLTEPATVTSALAAGSAERFLRALIDVIGSAIGG